MIPVATCVMGMAVHSGENDLIIERWRNHEYGLLSQSTIARYSSYLRDLAVHVEEQSLFDIGVAGLEEWIVIRAPTPSTRAQLNSAIKRFYGWAHSEGAVSSALMESVMARRVKMPSYQLGRKNIPVTDIPRILEAAPALGNGVPRRKAVVAVLFGTGLRLQECTGLRWGAVDLERQWLTVSAEDAKGGRERPVPIPDWTARILADYRQAVTEIQGLSTAPEAPVWPSAGDPSRPASWRTIHQDFKTSVLRVEEPPIPKELAHPHAARHTYALTVAIGANVRTCQLNLGHVSLETTARYLDLPEAARKSSTQDAMSRIEELVR